MARPPRFHNPNLAELLRQLRYAPDDTIARQMKNATALLNEIDPEKNYPEDFLFFRIIGMRSDMQSPGLFPGIKVIPDLARFIEGLTKKLDWPRERYEHLNPLTTQQVLDRLNISRVTLHRYRRQGLVAYRVQAPAGGDAHVYPEEAIARFEATHAGQLAKARQFSRIDPVVRQTIIEEARALAQREALSLNATAARLAQSYERSHDAIRNILIQHDRAHNDNRVFNDVGPLTNRQESFLLRAFDRGLPTSDLARHVGKSSSTVYRCIAQQRAARLHDWSWGFTHLPTFDREDADSVILASPGVSDDLPESLATWASLADFLTTGDEHNPADSAEQRTRFVAALNFLLHRAHERRSSLPSRQPAAADIDAIETDLRWASRLKRHLLNLLAASIRSTLELHINRPLSQYPAHDVIALHALAVETTMHAIDTFDPIRQPDLVSVVVHALRTALARRADEIKSTTARVRADPQAVLLPDLQSRLHPWWRTLEWPALTASVFATLSDQQRTILTHRLGLGGQAPRTQCDIATELQKPVHRIAAAEQSARRLVRQAWRSMT